MSVRVFFYFIFIFSHFSLRYTEIGPSEFVGAKSKVLYLMRATCGNQKTPDSTGQNWSEQKVKLIHISRATREYQNIGVSSNSTRYEFSPK